MKHPEIEADGYPSKETFEAIESWPIGSNKDVLELLMFVSEAWNYMFQVETGTCHDGDWIRVVTWGSGSNKDLIESLQQNHMFWGLCWLESQRGGSYKFLTQPLKEKL